MVAENMARENEQFELPEALAEGLREAYTHRVEISAQRDRAVLGAARVEFGRRRRMRIVTWWGTGMAAAIAAMIVVVVWLHHGQPQRTVAKGDINADGRVNIVDALVLARHVANKDQVEKGWDLNGDGVVDQQDVDALAAASVSLKGPVVARGSLPKLHELGIDHGLPVGFASANGISHAAKTTFAEANTRGGTFAEANPTNDGEERR
jgi:Dockerin type I domain